MLKIVSMIAVAGIGAAWLAADGIASAGATEPQDANAVEKTDTRLGPEVNRICFQSTINGWKEIKGEDDVVLLERGVNHWYRAELAGGCRSTLFRSALSIGIESRPAGGCITRGDVIIVRDAPGFDRRCVITKMNEWNDDAGADSADESDGDSN